MHVSGVYLVYNVRIYTDCLNQYFMKYTKYDTGFTADKFVKVLEEIFFQRISLWDVNSKMTSL